MLRRSVLVWVGIMRGVSLISLIAASLSLAACAGGGGSSALSLAKTLEACIKCGAVADSSTDPATDPVHRPHRPTRG
jgi:hypothetical protein